MDHWHSFDKINDEFLKLGSENPTIQSTEYFYENINGKEITSGVITIDGDVGLPILEIESKNDFYDLEAKYTPGKTTFILPADVTQAVESKIIEISNKFILILNVRAHTY